jgi:hypothetical protein
MASKGPSESTYRRSSFQDAQPMPQMPKSAAKSSTATNVRVSSAILSLSHDQIARRAKAIWQAKGCPQGQDQQNWLEAEKQLHAELRSH